MEFQILDAFAIHPQPLIDIGILLAGVLFLNFLDAILIETGQDWTERQPKDGTLSAAPTASIRFASRKLGKFSMDFHANAAAISRSNPGPR
jgi:hypothetical protein